MTVWRTDCTLPTPEENLALDEALLRLCETHAATADACGYLRFWESSAPFVVLGVSSRLHDDVDVERCERDAVKVLRRASGGGTVLQGPGCLNFVLVLPLAGHPELQSIEGSYRSVIGSITTALRLPGASLRGSSDLAMGEFKFGGSAQKRTSRALLHHGTVLYGFALDLIPRYLREPERQPDYRRRRGHLEFVRNIPLSSGEIRSRVAEAWDAKPLDSSWKTPDVRTLVAEKYGRPEWTARF